MLPYPEPSLARPAVARGKQDGQTCDRAEPPRVAPGTQGQDKHANCSGLLCIGWGPLETGSGDGARLTEDMQAVMSHQPVEGSTVVRVKVVPPVIPSCKSLGQEALSRRRGTPEKCQGPPK